MLTKRLAVCIITCGYLFFFLCIFLGRINLGVMSVQVNLTDIFSKEFEGQKIEKTFIVDKIQFNKEIVPVPDGIYVHLEVNKISNKEILLKGLVRTQLIVKCDRCNDPVKYLLEADFSKEVTVSQLTQEEDDFIEGYNLDLEKLALNEIYLNFPMKALCKEDCKSICLQCGINLNVGECHCESDPIDPRLAGLKDLFNENFKEV